MNFKTLSKLIIYLTLLICISDTNQTATVQLLEPQELSEKEKEESNLLKQQYEKVFGVPASSDKWAYYGLLASKLLDPSGPLHPELRPISKKETPAQAWEEGIKNTLIKLGIEPPTSKIGKYTASAGVSGAQGTTAAFTGIYTAGTSVNQELRKKYQEALAQGDTLAAYSYRTLQGVTLAAMGAASTILSPFAALGGAAGGALGLTLHTILDINDVLKELQAKLNNDDLSPQEAVQAAQELEEDVKEL